MQMILRYLERSIELRNLAAIETDPRAKADLEKQSRAYRALAERRASERNLPMPDEKGL